MFRRLIALAVAAWLLAGCASDPGEGDRGFVAGDGSFVVLAPEDRQPVPEISGETLDGDVFQLSAYLGSVVVLNVWASWCAPCRAEAPILQEVWEESEPLGVQFVGLDTRDSDAAARAFVERFGITYPNVIDRDGRLQLRFGDSLPPQAIPSTVIVDRQGRVAARVLGTVSAATLRTLLLPLIEEGT
jgi:thiol-disulfide isomerase/thioredoxin